MRVESNARAQRWDGAKLVVIGLDAATFSVIDPLIAAGELPHLAEFFDQGSRGKLHSTIPPVTSQAWATAFTGVNAGRHGLWDFVARAEGAYGLRVVNGSFCRSPALWTTLSAAGRVVGIVNVPFTWPARPVNGFLLAGFDAGGRERGFAYPASLVRELRARFGSLELDHFYPIGREGVIDLEQVRRAVEQKVEVALWLAERFQPELLVVVFMALDHVQHFGWMEWEEMGLESQIAESYRIIDRAVGALRQAAGSTGDVMVLSDHGAGRLKGSLNLNAWLAEEGYLVYERARVPPKAAGARAVAALLAIYGRLPARVRRSIKQRMALRREQMRELGQYTPVDWSRTRAFAYGRWGSVVINVRCRERQGIVEPGEEYERVCAEIAARALELRDPETGQRVVSAVHRREALLHGPELTKMPDLVFDLAEHEWVAHGSLKRRPAAIWEAPYVAADGHRILGWHRPEGVIALAGPSARRGGEIFASLADIAPTITYLLGEPVPSAYEGRVLEEALDPALLGRRPPVVRDDELVDVPAVESYSREEAELVAARLRGLGYLD